MNIDRTHRLPEEEIYAEPQKKKQIYLHHTVSGSFRSVWDYWTSDRNADGTKRHVATAFVIDKDGTIYEIFDPHLWAHHLGIPTKANLQANKESIGIEIVSEGALVKRGPNLYWLDGAALFRSNSTNVVTLTNTWRSYRYFDAYEDAQMAALCELVPALCTEFGIPPRLVGGDPNRYDIGLLSFGGVLTHCNVRPDKSDVHPGFDWKLLENALIAKQTEAG